MVKKTQKSIKNQVKQVLNSYKDNEYLTRQDSKIIIDIYQPYLQIRHGEKNNKNTKKNGYTKR